MEEQRQCDRCDINECEYGYEFSKNSIGKVMCDDCVEKSNEEIEESYNKPTYEELFETYKEALIFTIFENKKLMKEIKKLKGY